VTAVLLLVLVAVLLWPGRATDRPAPDARRVRGPVRAHLPRRRVGGEWVAELAEVTTVGLRAGLDLPAAVGVAARSPTVRSAAPWLGTRVAAAVDGGAGVSECLADAPSAGPDERSDLAVLARAWRLSEHTGAAASRTTAGAAAAIRARAAARERVAAALAGPRASMRLLTLLPLGGPVVGLLLGLSPGELYGSLAARAAAVLGLGLTAVGWWWSRGLVGRALRPGRTDGSP
jgi:tight adherence protein B